ncbi:MAG: hypothetical protein ACI8QS_001129 [Planctomycetota bacterium]|jgi:hypothetical protein
MTASRRDLLSEARGASLVCVRSGTAAGLCGSPCLLTKSCVSFSPLGNLAGSVWLNDLVDEDPYDPSNRRFFWPSLVSPRLPMTGELPGDFRP